MAKTIEIVNFRLADGVTDEAFIERTMAMERDFLGKLQGFLDRDTGKSTSGDWVVVLHWAQPEDAQASMDKFVGNPGTKSFTDMIDMSTFKMTRFELRDHYE
ncbi:MAG: hypothetical protein WCS20_14285 [Alphaproteobacteria bacterium]